LEKGIHGTLAQQEIAYAYLEGKHGALDDDWGFYIHTTQEYKNNREKMMAFIKGYNEYERR
jgi:hypothetical protein